MVCLFRNILGPLKAEFGNWRARFNNEIEELLSEPNTFGEINGEIRSADIVGWGMWKEW